MGEVVPFGWREKEEICQDFYSSFRKHLSGCHMQREFTGGMAGGREAEGPGTCLLT